MADTSESPRIRVLLVDDQRVVRPGLRGYLEVLTLVGHGRSNKEIATDLGITERTARTHVALSAVERKLVKD